MISAPATALTISAATATIATNGQSIDFLVVGISEGPPSAMSSYRGLTLTWAAFGHAHFQEIVRKV